MAVNFTELSEDPWRLAEQDITNFWLYKVEQNQKIIGITQFHGFSPSSLDGCRQTDVTVLIQSDTTPGLTRVILIP